MMPSRLGSGFPEGQPSGNDAYGTIGAALGDGFVRLDTHSRYRVETGFSGSGLWSPDYDAVIGVIGMVFTGDSEDDRRGMRWRSRCSRRPSASARKN
jgi:hypothetical protein